MKSLDESVNEIPLGTKDAVHVPYIVVRGYDEVNAGDWVRFTDSNQERVESCDKSEAIGIINPFMDSISYDEHFVVLLMPGITTPVHHQFEIDATKYKYKNSGFDDYDCRNCN